MRNTKQNIATVKIVATNMLEEAKTIYDLTNIMSFLGTCIKQPLKKGNLGGNRIKRVR